MIDHRPHDPGEALERASRVARDAGIDPRGARLIRASNAVLVEFPPERVIVRLDRRQATAALQVKVATILERRSIPAARLIDRAVYPADDGTFGTFWERLEELPRPPTVQEMGVLCRDALPHDASVLTHGDFHADNVLVTPSGPKMIDLEDAGIAPASWDFAPSIVAVRRHGRDESEYAGFCEAYGADLMEHPEGKLLCDVYELFLVSWAIAYRSATPAMTAEAVVRLESLLGRITRRWTIL